MKEDFTQGRKAVSECSGTDVEMIHRQIASPDNCLVSALK